MRPLTVDVVQNREITLHESGVILEEEVGDSGDEKDLTTPNSSAWQATAAATRQSSLLSPSH